jgi:uncharacterized protein with HEPN domain
MPRRDPDLLIEDILTAISKIERYTTGLTRQFQQDENTLDAVVRDWRSGRIGTTRLNRYCQIVPSAYSTY